MNIPVYIRAVASYVPDAVISNSHFERFLETTASWIAERTGIVERRYLSGYEGDSPGYELIQRAYTTLAQDPAFDRERVDLIISASSHHDQDYPNAADRISQALGTVCPCFQLQAACSSVAYAVSVARAMLLSTPSMRDILIVCGEAFTRYADYGERSSAILFGDGACALVISRDACHGALEIVDVEIGGEGRDIVTSNRRSSTSHLSVQDLIENRRVTNTGVGGEKFWQNGRAVVDWISRVMPPAIDASLRRNCLAATDIDVVITHQANLRVMESLVDRAGFRRAAHRYVIDRYGNMSSAGWVIALAEARAGLQTEANVMVAVFGAGMTWATLLLRATG